MFSESSGSFCFVGVSSNSAVFVSDKDLNGNNMDPPELGDLLVRPSVKIHKEECQTSIAEEEHELVTMKPQSVQERDKEEVKAASVPVAPLRNLRVEIPLCKGSEKDDSEDGLKTPTSSDQRIPVIPECPGAPRKRKSRPAAKKRKDDDDCRQQQVVPADLWQELESLFPNMQLVVDLGAGGKIKRFKQCSVG